MLKWFHAQRQKHDIAADIYNRLVAYARRPEFYLSYGVPDTMLAFFFAISPAWEN
jgi:hypothetical protein